MMIIEDYMKYHTVFTKNTHDQKHLQKYHFVLLWSLNKLQKLQIRQWMLFIVMIFCSASKFVQFIFIVGQAQIIDVVVLQEYKQQDRWVSR